jgi:hypothetical protein
MWPRDSFRGEAVAEVPTKVKPLPDRPIPYSRQESQESLSAGSQLVNDSGQNVHDDNLDVLRSVVAEVIGNPQPRRRARGDSKTVLVLRVSGDGLDPALR